MEETLMPNTVIPNTNVQPPVEKKSKKKLIIGFMLVLILGILIATAFVLFNPKSEDHNDDSQDNTVEENEDTYEEEDEQDDEEEEENTPEDTFSTSDFKEFSFSVKPLPSYKLDINFEAPKDGALSDTGSPFSGKEFKSSSVNFQMAFPYEFLQPKTIDFVDFEKLTNLGNISKVARIKLEEGKFLYVGDFDPTKDCTGMGSQVTKAPCVSAPSIALATDIGIFFECQSEDFRYCDEILKSMEATRTEIQITPVSFKISESSASPIRTLKLNVVDLKDANVTNTPFGNTDVYGRYTIDAKDYTLAFEAGVEFFVSEIDIISEMGSINNIGAVTIVKHRVQENPNQYFFISKSNISNEDIPANGVYGDREAPLATTTIKFSDSQLYVSCTEKSEGGFEKCIEMVKTMTIE